jgi:catechol 2,3-dioxygenase-like lactoylglutathione lyase family enzyme
MLSGAHIVMFTHNVEADRAFFRDVLQLNFVDAGNGRLFFALPPAEIGFHDIDPADTPSTRLYLMSDDINATTAALHAKGVAADLIQDLGWGLMTGLQLPSGAHLAIYQPRHVRPQS